MMHKVHKFPASAVPTLKTLLSKSVVGSGSQNGKQIVFGPMRMQVATDFVATLPGSVTVKGPMVLTHGEKYPYGNQYPDRTKPMQLLHSMIGTEYITEKFCGNTKVITVDGNIGVGKLDFAKRLAKEFDLKVWPSTPEDGCFSFGKGTNIDIRIFDQLLPEFARTYEYKNFLEDPDPKGRLAKGIAGSGWLQCAWYKERFLDYCEALDYVLSTGQGVVMVRSAYSDFVFAQAIHDVGWISQLGLKHYMEVYNNTSIELMTPHVAIYLDAPVDVCKQRLAQKNDPMYANAKNLTDEYLHAIEANYKQKVLPHLRKHSEVLEIDWSTVADDLDMGVIAEELTHLRLHALDKTDEKFQAWYGIPDREWNAVQQCYACPEGFLQLYFPIPMPWDAPEMMTSTAQDHAFWDIVEEHELNKYAKGWGPVMDNPSFFKRYFALW